MVEGDEAAAALGAYVLVVDFVAVFVGEAVIVAEFVENDFEVFDVALGSVLLAGDEAGGLLFVCSGFLVHGYAQRADALDHVEELAKGDVEEKSDDADHVYPNNGVVPDAAEKVITDGERHACDGNEGDDYEREDVFVEGLGGSFSCVGEASVACHGEADHNEGGGDVEGVEG